MPPSPELGNALGKVGVVKVFQEMEAKDSAQTDGHIAVAGEIKVELEGKSDAELARDILRMKEQLEANNISPQQQIAIVRKLMPMMDANQKARLQRVIELLK